MNENEQTIYYNLPPLNDEFMFQIIFCMEDQGNEYVLDLQKQLIVEHVFVEEREEADANRFLELPEWLPSDGYHTMEKFVATLRNPVYREKLRDVLQAGRGVFRQFKNVVHEMPAVERLWFHFKDMEMQKRIYEWYELYDASFTFSRLPGEGMEDESLDALREDFQFSDDIETYSEAYEELKEECLALYEHRNIPYKRYLLDEIGKAWQIGKGDHIIFALTPSNEVAGAILWHHEPGAPAVIRAYCIRKSFRGLGLFHLLFDRVCERSNSVGASDIILELWDEFIPMESMFREIKVKSIKKSIFFDNSSWIDWKK